MRTGFGQVDVRRRSKGRAAVLMQAAVAGSLILPLVAGGVAAAQTVDPVLPTLPSLPSLPRAAAVPGLPNAEQLPAIPTLPPAAGLPSVAETVAPVTTSPIDTAETPAPAPAAAPLVQGPDSAIAVAPQEALPEGSVTSVTWLSDRRVSLRINSPAMGTSIQVQILLARDWNMNTASSFPSVLMLDGLRATDIENGWTAETDAESWFADKNVNVILPVGGQSSFYTNWLTGDNGKNYQWETFLIKELPPILERDWRTTQTRGVVGLSMGGTAAMTLAARNPGFFKFAGSLSGILSTTSLGMPQAIQYAMTDAGNYHSAAMWGDPSNPLWAQHDPLLLADKLKGTSLYVSSGNGVAGPYDQPSGIPGVSTNYAGTGLEILARLTAQNFAGQLNKLGIPAQVNYRPSGTHSWPYWQFELHQLWPQLAGALGVATDKPGCAPGGAIAGAVAANSFLGDCLTPEYDVVGGRAQDYRYGRVFFSNDTGAQVVAGAIGGVYQGYKDTGGILGFPKTGELGTPDGRGRFNVFQNGSIYFTPQTGAHVVRGAIGGEWANEGYERGPLGYPVLDEVQTPNKPGAVQGFEVGAMYYSPGNGTHEVQGAIMAKYGALGYENGALGFPQTNEIGVKDGGRFNQFEGGNIYWSPATGAWSIFNGQMFDAWRSVGYEAGRLGFLTSDQFDIPGGVQQNFQFGFITIKNGQVQITP